MNIDSTRGGGVQSTSQFNARDPARLFMVKSVEIKNFRGFESFKVDNLARINLIVGDNAVGKTALLESIFLTMSGSGDKGLHLKSWRGLDVTLQKGSADVAAEAIYGDLFHDPSSPEPITIESIGEGFESRKLTIAKTRGDVFVPTAPTPTIAPNRHERRKRAKQPPAAQPTSVLGNQITTAPKRLTYRCTGSESRAKN